ncbi:cysteine--tRNA ligase [bacterium]|nr:cysteine--tRNA ligase [bacterium]
MPLRIYNTATRKKEEFKSLEPGKVKMYVCGPTVYDYFHVGNARAFIVFDTLRRVLKRCGWEVTYVQNITDVDDKIINKAKQEKTTAEEVAGKYTEAFLADLAALGCEPADQHPKATEHIPEIIALVEKIIEKGHAYVVAGDVFFSVRSFQEYGKLFGKKIDELEEGARVNVDVRKKDPLDFALWKAAKSGEPAWDSPWGKGRPGWHIECSAMSMKYLGENFDIHGGGADLIFPHHENENAQSQSVTGKPLAQYWMHNGYLEIKGEKMSKSLGNFWLTRDVLQKTPFQVLRLFMLSAHYRSPLDFNPKNVESVQNGYFELKRTMERLHEIVRHPMKDDFLADDTAGALDKERQFTYEQFEQALDDDLNTAQAIGQVFRLANKVRQVIANRPKKTYQLYLVFQSIQSYLLDMTNVLGMLPEIQPVPDDLLKMIAERNEARQKKDWALSDQLRDQITGQGYALEDTPFGSLALTETKTSLQEIFR